MTNSIHHPEHSSLAGEHTDEHWRVFGNEAQMINTDQIFDSRDTGFETNPDYVPTTDPRALAAEEEEARS